MKKTMMIALALFFTGILTAQNTNEMKINTVVVRGSGDVVLRQGPQFKVIDKDGDRVTWNTVDSVLNLSGSHDYEVTLEALGYLESSSSGDIVTDGTLRADNLLVQAKGSGDVKLDLDYDNVTVKLDGSGDVILRGYCEKLQIDDHGSGDVINSLGRSVRVKGQFENLAELMAELGRNLDMLSDSVDWKSFEEGMERWGESMEEWGRHMEEWGDQVGRQMEDRGRRPNRKEGKTEQWGKGTPDLVPQPEVRVEKPQPRPEKRSLLMDPYWGGVDFGLNMLFGPGSSANFEGDYSFLELKPLKSWVFNFNIADVGLAFDRKHTAGIYTGIGLGWNNYSFNRPVRLVMGDDHLYGDPIDETVEGPVKKSKLGVLYVQAPLMLEVRPTRSFFIAAGVTGGVRVDSWTKVKFRDRYKEKVHGSYYLNPIKLDATLRAGGCDFGFFASYNLLPEFIEPKGPSAHAFNVGFTLIF